MSITIQDLIDAAYGDGFSEEQVAGIGLLLAQHRKVVDAALESVKTKLRQSALEKKKQGKSFVNIDGRFLAEQDGFIQVTFMDPVLRLKKGQKPTEVPDHEQYFIKKVSYIPKKNLQALLKASGLSIFEYFEVSEPMPRVGFRDKPTKK